MSIPCLTCVYSKKMQVNKKKIGFTEVYRTPGHVMACSRTEAVVVYRKDGQVEYCSAHRKKKDGR